MRWLYLKILDSFFWLIVICSDNYSVNGRQMCYNCSVEVNLWKEEPFHATFPTDDIDCVSNNRATLNRMSKRPNRQVACQGARHFCGTIFTEYSTNAALFRITRGCFDLWKDDYWISAWEYGRVDYKHADVRQRCSTVKHEFEDGSVSPNVPEKRGKLIVCVCTEGQYCNDFTYDSLLLRYFHTIADSLTRDTEVDFASWWAEEPSDVEPVIKDLDDTTPAGFTGITTAEFRWNKTLIGMDTKSGQCPSFEVLRVNLLFILSTLAVVLP